MYIIRYVLENLKWKQKIWNYFEFTRKFIVLFINCNMIDTE